MASSNSTISIGFKIENGANGFQNLVLNAEDLRKVLRENVVEAEALKAHLINFASVATGTDSISEVIAPLDKLRDIIGTAGGGQPVIVGGRIEVSGRQLAVVLDAPPSFQLIKRSPGGRPGR